MRVTRSINSVVLCYCLLSTLAICIVTPALAKPFYFEDQIDIGSTQTELTEAFEVGSPDNDPWSKEEVISPEGLASLLSGERKPVVIQTGIIHLYKQAHIPGSRFTGPPTNPEGLDRLKKEIQGLPRTTEIIFYCGCCPWMDCPNIRPAYKSLKEMGFKKLRVLYLPNNFTQDWVLKKLPVEKGGL